ncbi:class I SAM-dependent methyltransferase family protein [Streptomyces tsukubensis]|uniref:class I SAM-dependent methyltransferase family protein n=1 Tax=Streptomyces tsukubensis TaxID=83656 RepID=UPI00344F987D
MTKRLKSVQWAAMRLLMGSAGRLSNGIRIGYRHGFDSGSMLDYVYVNKARGSLGIGRIIDRCYLNAIGWRAIRARRELLKDVLRKEIAGRGGRAVVLDIASGPGRYLQDLVEGYPAGAIRVECRDLDPSGLSEGERQARERGLTGIAFTRGDALDPGPLADGTAPDVIVVSGLYELLLDDAVIAASVERLRGLLAPGGVLVFTTQTRHPQLEFIAEVLPNRDGVPWVMKCRPVELAERWARDAGYSGVSSGRETVGLFTVTTAVR